MAGFSLLTRFFSEFFLLLKPLKFVRMILIVLFLLLLLLYFPFLWCESALRGAGGDAGSRLEPLGQLKGDAGLVANLREVDGDAGSRLEPLGQLKGDAGLVANLTAAARDASAEGSGSYWRGKVGSVSLS